MSKYRTCPHCGAHLDYGERCDCREGAEGNGPGRQSPDKILQKECGCSRNTQPAA